MLNPFYLKSIKKTLFQTFSLIPLQNVLVQDGREPQNRNAPGWTFLWGDNYYK